MGCTIDVVSIGTLSNNPFWNEQGKVRAPHATTVLIRDGGTTILVDPSLPSELLIHRLDERTGLKPEQIDVVFLTSFRPVHRRSLGAFESARWLMSEEERSSVVVSLSAALAEVDGGAGTVVSSPVEVQHELALAQRTEPAPERLGPTVQLFPSPGATVGTAGLLVAGLKTTVIAGDAVLTRDHFEHGRVFERSADPDQARQSFADIVEIADIIVPGHDNVIVAA